MSDSYQPKMGGFVASWCDKLASTPSVGFRFAAHYQSGDSILHALAPLLDKLATPTRQRFTIELHESFRVQLVTEDGFQYYFDQNRMFVEFKHRLRVRAQSGGPPTAELLTKPRPYTELLSEVGARAIDAVEMVYARPRPLERIGVVSTTSFSIEDAPPGVVRFRDYLMKPWGRTIEHFDVHVTAEVESSPEHTDRCLHSLTRPEDAEQLMNIKLDWQRTFSPMKTGTTDVLKKQTAVAEKAALAYFEQIGEGNKFDEYIDN